MITFDLMQLFYRRKWRWSIALSCLFLFSFVYPHMSQVELRPITVWDYVLGEFTQQFNCIVIIPVFFLYLTVDLVVNDFQEGYAEYTFSRSTSRISWYLSKVCTLFIAANIYTLGLGLAYLIASFISGMSFEAGFSEHAPLYQNVPPYVAMVTIFALFVTTLTSFGVFVLLLTLYTRSTTMPWIIGAIIACISYSSWMISSYRAIYKWMPTAHEMLLSIVPNKISGTHQELSFQSGITYNIVFFLGSLILGINRFRRMNLGKMD